ncbi:MAG: transcriptional regulator, partial [Myxococcales bacterium]|nr:transcriptional regulator [Myxococcales bacterium]
MVKKGDERPDRPLSSWEASALEAVAGVIEFWGFKRNQGRLWTLLYLRGVALTAAQIQSVLDLSKGAVSMVTREMEQWSVIHRLRHDDSNSWHFAAETSLVKMV